MGLKDGPRAEVVGRRGLVPPSRGAPLGDTPRRCPGVLVRGRCPAAARVSWAAPCSQPLAPRAAAAYGGGDGVVCGAWTAATPA